MLLHQKYLPYFLIKISLIYVQVIEKEAIIQELQDQISALKEKLSRKPGVEVTDKLKIKENELREKARQMKAMAGELNMNQAQVSYNVQTS